MGRNGEFLGFAMKMAKSSIFIKIYKMPSKLRKLSTPYNPAHHIRNLNNQSGAMPVKLWATLPSSSITKDGVTCPPHS